MKFQWGEEIFSSPPDKMHGKKHQLGGILLNENIAQKMIDLFLLQHEFDDKLHELGISFTEGGEIGEMFHSMEDTVCDLLLDYMSISDDHLYDSITDIYQKETETADIFHSLKKLQAG